MMRTMLPWMALALISCGCSSGLNRPVREVTATQDSTGVQHVKITTHSFWFDPNRIVVKAGVPVELELHNGSLVVPHNFTCEATQAGMEMEADLGMLKGGHTLRFTPTQPGEYKFFCDKGSHAKKGMTGTIVVVQ